MSLDAVNKKRSDQILIFLSRLLDEDILADQGFLLEFLDVLQEVTGSVSVFLSLEQDVWSQASHVTPPKINISFLPDLMEPKAFHLSHGHESMPQDFLEWMKTHHIESVVAVPLGSRKSLIFCFKDFHESSEISQEALLLCKAIKLQCHLKEQHRLLDETIRAKKDFLSNTSHEFRTPLSGIHNAFYLLNTTSLSPEQHLYVDHGMTSADALSSIIDDVLDYAHLDSQTAELFPVPFDLELEMIRIYKQFVDLAKEKGLEFHFDFDYRIMHTFRGDLGKIRSIANHLIGNAIKYTEKGNVVFAVERISNQEKEDVIRFTVTDTGQGIQEDKMNRVQQAFEQEDNSPVRVHQGLGLGLSIVKELTRVLGGHLHVKSKIQEGSSFSVVIPLVHLEPYPEFHLSGKTILLGDPASCSLPIDRMLSSMGAFCQTYHDSDKKKSDIIIFSDPTMNKTDLLQIKIAYGKSRVLLISMGQNIGYHADIDRHFEWPMARTVFDQNLSSLEKSFGKIIDRDSYESKLKGHALIVDDNRLNRVALESILLKQGVSSSVAESGEIAIDMARKHHFDIIFMDIQMPGMDGLEATRRIRLLGSDKTSVPIIAITANAYFQDYDLMKQRQISDVLFKPIRMDQLIQVLRKHLNTEQGIHIPDELQVFDQIEFEERFEGSDDIALEVMETFILEYAKDLASIREAMHLKDPIKVHEATHYFKGSCAYVSGKRVVWLLTQMTQLAKKATMEPLIMVFESLHQETDALVKTLTQYRERMHP